MLDESGAVIDGIAIDGMGGSFAMPYTTVAVTAARTVTRPGGRP